MSPFLLARRHSGFHDDSRTAGTTTGARCCETRAAGSGDADARATTAGAPNVVGAISRGGGGGDCCSGAECNADNRPATCERGSMWPE